MQVSRATARLGRLALSVLVIGILGVLGAPAASAGPLDKTITPFVDCYFDNGDGTFTFSVGVTSTNAGTVTVPVGSENKVDHIDAAVKEDFGQPSVFHPGTHQNVWAPTITAKDVKDKAHWEITNLKVQLVTVGTPVCSEKPVPAEGNALAVVGFSVLVTAVGAWLLSGRRGRDGAVSPT